MNLMMPPDFFCHLSGLEKCACVRVHARVVCVSELQGKPTFE